MNENCESKILTFSHYMFLQEVHYAIYRGNKKSFSIGMISEDLGYDIQISLLLITKNFFSGYNLIYRRRWYLSACLLISAAYC